MWDFYFLTDRSLSPNRAPTARAKSAAVLCSVVVYIVLVRLSLGG